MRTLVVTAANQEFMPLLRGLVLSLQRWPQRPYAGLACFDLGLDEASRAWLLGHDVKLLAPGWDLPVAERQRTSAPHLRALTVRPFLPRWWPGYELYLWIDADCWVQERFALDWYIAAAADGALAVVPQVDRAYRADAGVMAWRTGRMSRYAGRLFAKRVYWDRYVNAGVFALRADAPHWQHWADSFAQGLQRTRGELVCDQTALNHALWVRNLPIHPLPALCNWLCHLAEPGYDRSKERFCEPLAPRGVLGVLHLTGQTKQGFLCMRCEGEPHRISLRFREDALVT